MAYIDPYLEHSIEASENPNASYPFLMEVTDEWPPLTKVEGLRILGLPIVNIYAATGTQQAIEELRNDPRVIRLEASRPGYWD